MTDILEDILTNCEEVPVGEPADDAASVQTRNGSGPRLESVCLATVPKTPTRWLWRRRIQMGTITLVAGRPGAGKSTFGAYLASVISQDEWNFVRDERCRHHGDVLYLTSEASPEDIQNRIEAAGGDLGRCYVITSVIDKKSRLVKLDDVDVIDADLTTRAKMNRPVRLIVIDPIASYFGGKANSHKDNEVRELLAPFCALAQKHNLAVVVIHHTRKDCEHTVHGDDMIGGSGGGFGGIARNLLHVIADPKDESHVRLAAGKSNNSKSAPLLRYRLTEKVLLTEGVEWTPNIDEDEIDLRTSQRCEWLQSEDGDDYRNIDKVLAEDRKIRRSMEKESRPHGAETAIEHATDFLNGIFDFAHGGDPLTVVTAKELISQFEDEEGGKSHTLHCAKRNLAIAHTRVVKSGKPYTVWHTLHVAVATDGTVTEKAAATSASASKTPPLDQDVF